MNAAAVSHTALAARYEVVAGDPISSGYTTTCSCGWTSARLNTKKSAAMELRTHKSDVKIAASIGVVL